MFEELTLIYNEISTTIERKDGGVFLIYAQGGIRKTFIWNVLCKSLRSNGEICQPIVQWHCTYVLPKGRTTHS